MEHASEALLLEIAVQLRRHRLRWCNNTYVRLMSCDRGNNASLEKKIEWGSR